jgi:hypothetical protein
MLTATCHASKASVRNRRFVAEVMRCRQMLKVLYTEACAERNLCADPADRKRCIFRSRRRTGTCELSARLFWRKPLSCAIATGSAALAAELHRQPLREPARGERAKG